MVEWKKLLVVVEVHFMTPHWCIFICFLIIIFSLFLYSIHQTELVNWVSAVYVETLGEIQRQSVCKGVYNALLKNFEKVENEEDGNKPHKRGTVRWRRMKNLDQIQGQNLSQNIDQNNNQKQSQNLIQNQNLNQNLNKNLDQNLDKSQNQNQNQNINYSVIEKESLKKNENCNENHSEGNGNKDQIISLISTESATDDSITQNHWKLN